MGVFLILTYCIDDVCTVSMLIAAALIVCDETERCKTSRLAMVGYSL